MYPASLERRSRKCGTGIELETRLGWQYRDVAQMEEARDLKPAQWRFDSFRPYYD